MNPVFSAMTHAHTEVLTFSKPKFSQIITPNCGVIANFAQKNEANGKKNCSKKPIFVGKLLFDLTTTHNKPNIINFS